MNADFVHKAKQYNEDFLIVDNDKERKILVGDKALQRIKEDT